MLPQRSGPAADQLGPSGVEVFGTPAKHPRDEPADRQQEEERDEMEGGMEGGLVSIQTSLFMGTLLLSCSRSLHRLSTLDSMSTLLLMYCTIVVIS